jgi:hypothetical protein
MWTVFREFLRFCVRDKKWWLIPLVVLLLALAVVLVTGQLKTGHLRALQNRPLRDADFITVLVLNSRDFSRWNVVPAPAAG